LPISVPSDAAHTRAFRAIARDYLDRLFGVVPEMASGLGLAGYDSALSANTPAMHRELAVLAKGALRGVEALPASAFDGDDWLDRRLLLSMLRTAIFFGETHPRWRINPQVHCDGAVGAIFQHVVRHGDRLGRMLPAIEARLDLLPDYLAAGAECVSRPVPIWRDLAIKSCDGAREFLGELGAQLEAISPRPIRTRNLLRRASAAFADYADAIARKKPGPAGSFAVGRDNFEFLMRERLGFDLSLPEARAEGERLVARMRHLVDREAARFGKRPADEILQAAAAGWDPGSDLLARYRETTIAIRDKLRGADLVTLPARERLEVREVPAFMRHQFPTAAYSAPGPFARDQRGIFWVNDLGRHAPDGAARAAEIRQHFGLDLTCVHEGYPGHHLQFIVQNRHPSRIRRLADHSIFYEGWTLWCEEMAIRHKLFEDPHARLIQLHDALWRAYRILIDCGLQDGTLTIPGASRILREGVGFTAARARGDVNWYSSSPTIPMSYLLGRCEVEKLHRRFVVRGGWTLREFNNWMLGHGAIPWSWILRAHLG